MGKRRAGDGRKRQDKCGQHAAFLSAAVHRMESEEEKTSCNQCENTGNPKHAETQRSGGIGLRLNPCPE